MRTFAGIMAACLLAGLGSSVLAQDSGGSTSGDTKKGNAAENSAQQIEKMKEKRDAQFTERKAKWQKRHDEMIAKLKEKLAANKRLTDEEKQDVISFFEQQYKENKDFHSVQHEETMKFLDSLAGETDLTKDQIKDKFKAFIEKQKTENKEHRAKQEAERKAERAKVKSEAQQNAQSSTNQVAQ